jgi:thiamine transport system permease protein
MGAALDPGGTEIVSTRRQALLFALPALCLLMFMVIAPAARLSLVESPSFSTIWRDHWLQGVMAWSVAQAAISCLLCCGIGLPIAWVLARLEFPGRLLIVHSLTLPFVVPTLVAAIGVLAMLGDRAPWMRMLGLGLEGTPWLLLYGNVFFNLCIVVRAGIDALENVSASEVAAARTLGASPWRAFWRIEWPAIAPWLASSLCLVFLYCFSGFGLALLLGGQQWATIEVEIYTLVANELQLGKASALALIALAITCAAALAYSRLERTLVASPSASRIPRHAPHGYERIALCFALLSLLAICVAPLSAIVLRVVTISSGAWQVLLEAETLLALRNTIAFSACAVILATVLGLLHALAAHRLAWLRSIAFFPLMVSPVTVAFGLLLLYPSLSASKLMIVLAYTTLAFPFIAKSIASGLDALPPNCLNAARSLGASPWRTFRRIVLPLLQPSLRRGVAFASATALGEFAVSLFLSRPEWATLSTLIYQRLGRPGSANLDAALVLSGLLMTIALGAFVALFAGSHNSQKI